MLSNSFLFLILLFFVANLPTYKCTPLVCSPFKCEYVDSEPQQTEVLSSDYSWYSSDGEFGVSGADVVEYFSLSSDDNGVDGDESYQTEWEGIKWKFKNETNLSLFESNPTDYAPRFGGYDAYAMASGYSAAGSPNAWIVYNGHLYIFYNRNVRNTWNNNKDSNIEDADENWGQGVFDYDNWDADF